MARAVHSSPTGLTGGDIWNHTRPTVDVGEAYGEEALSCSLTGKYSQSPPRSSHRRSPMPHFGTATKEISSKSPYDPLFVLEVPSSIGRQFQSHTRSPISMPRLFATRDQAQQVYPAFAPVPAGTAAVGPGAYRPPESFGKQAQSKNRSAGKAAIGSSIRMPELRSDTPGPQYLPKATFLSSSFRVVDVTFPTATRPSPVMISHSPGPVYSPPLNKGKRMPAFRFSTSKRF